MNANLHLVQLNASLAPDDQFIARLESRARETRRTAIAAIYHAGSGHPGGSLSCADLLAVLYGAELGEANRFILSKGHAAPALYATWATFDLMETSEALSL